MAWVGVFGCEWSHDESQVLPEFHKAPPTASRGFAELARLYPPALRQRARTLSHVYPMHQ